MKLSHQTPVRKEKALFETIHKTSNEAERGPSEIVLKRWEEAIFYENHIIPRTYHSAIVYNSMLYVFGGYEYNTGIMNDFYCIDLDSKDPFVWKAIEKSKGTYPEALHRHTAILYQHKMYVYGGKTSVLNNSNKLYSYEFETNTWNEEKTTKEILPFFIDSHNAILYEQNEKAEMIVFGGFLGNYSKYSNNVFAFDLKKQEWKFYFENLPGKQKEKVINIQKQKPKKRSNSSINIIENFLFVFGGCKGSLKLNDLWKFDLINCSWRQIIYQNETAPEPRSGHIFIHINSDVLLLFGGIHDIAHEKNDVLCFEESSLQWIKIEEDSMRDLTKTFHQSPKIQSIHKGTENHIDKLMQPENTNKIKSTNHKKNPSAYFIRNVRKNRSPKSNKRKSTLERVFDIVPEGKSPLQLKEERVKKEKQMKKMLLLSQFDVDDDSKKEMLENSPTTEAMKNSIIAIKGETKINAMKEIYQNNIVVNGNSNTIKGKKPCARDGCTGNLFNGKLVIFGGDRHLMAFHDLYFLNIKHLI